MSNIDCKFGKPMEHWANLCGQLLGQILTAANACTIDDKEVAQRVLLKWWQLPDSSFVPTEERPHRSETGLMATMITRVIADLGREASRDNKYIDRVGAVEETAGGLTQHPIEYEEFKNYVEKALSAKELQLYRLLVEGEWELKSGYNRNLVRTALNTNEQAFNKRLSRLRTTVKSAKAEWDGGEDLVEVDANSTGPIHSLSMAVLQKALCTPTQDMLDTPFFVVSREEKLAVDELLNSLAIETGEKTIGGQIMDLLGSRTFNNAVENTSLLEQSQSWFDHESNWEAFQQLLIVMHPHSNESQLAEALKESIEEYSLYFAGCVNIRVAAHLLPVILQDRLIGITVGNHTTFNRTPVFKSLLVAIARYALDLSEVMFESLGCYNELSVSIMLNLGFAGCVGDRKRVHDLLCRGDKLVHEGVLTQDAVKKWEGVSDYYRIKYLDGHQGEEADSTRS